MKPFRKYTWLLLVMLGIFSVMSANAQSRISSVYGVNLGDSETVVASKVSGSWKTNTKTGKRYYFVSKPTLGNCTFQQATFNFDNGKLARVCFSSGDGGAMDPNFQGAYGAPNGYEQFLSTSQRYQQMYRRMVTDLSGKYGTPMIDDGSKAIWKSNGSSIEIEYDFEDNTNQYGWHDGWTRIAVTYSLGGGASSNF